MDTTNDTEVLSLRNHLDFVDDVQLYSIHGDFVRLLGFTNFSWCKLTEHNALSLILKYSTKKVIKHVINNMTSCNHQTDTDGRSLIHYLMIYARYDKLINSFIEKKHFDLECIDKSGCRPIHYACKRGSPVTLKYLITKGIDLKCTDNDGKQPIHYTCKYDDNPEIIQILVNNGADLEYTTNDGSRLIHIACRLSSLETIKYLVDSGVDLECENHIGWRPIHYICHSKSCEFIKYFLTLNIDLYSRTGVDNYQIEDLVKHRYNLSDKDQDRTLDLIFIIKYINAKFQSGNINKGDLINMVR